MRMATTWGIFVATCLLVAGHSARANVVVVEYHHAGFDHYFVTPVADEIAKLDAKLPPFEQWSRTGRTFIGYDAMGAPQGAAAVCRFFNETFAPKSSHFYTLKGLGCEDVIAKFPDWRLETDGLFAAMLPDASGGCPAGTVPVYRLYNNGITGAPNHRLVTSLQDRQAMLDKGYIPEGAGIGVGMCTPAPAGARATAEGMWRGVTTEGRAVWIVVLETGKYHLLHGDPASQSVGVGVVTGTLAYAAGGAISGDALEVHLTASLPNVGTSIQGTVSGDTLVLNLGGTRVTATYDAAYDRAADVAAIAGTFTGMSGHLDELGVMGTTRISLGAGGVLAIGGAQCDLAGTIRPGARGNVFEGAMAASGSCRGLDGLALIVVYDAVSRRLTALSVPFRNPLSGIMDVYAAFGWRN